LGDQLIASPRLAVFELVKNAYDADASDVLVRLENLGTPNAKIIVRDNGEGMTGDIIRNAWLVPADDHKEKQRLAGIRTKGKRFPVGEKGLGRFAVHKLGDVVDVTTHSKDDNEYTVQIDWRDLSSAEFLDQASVTVEGRKAELFTGKKTGTLIEVSALRDKDWSRGEIRRLYRQVMAFCSPFDGPDDFKVRMEVPGYEKWIAGIPDPARMLDDALWSFDFQFDKGKYDWNFSFRGLRALKLAPRTAKGVDETLVVPVPFWERELGEKKTKIALPELNNLIGPVRGKFRVFDRDKEVLALLPEKQLLKELLDENGGVRVYRDGVRVHDYGEHEDDWLGLDLRRVNTPTRRLSRNIVIGEVQLDLSKSSGLIEKTNREGFVEDAVYENLRSIVLGALTTLEAERKKDKDKIRALTGTGESKEGITRHLTLLREKSQKLGVLEDLGHSIDLVEKDYKEMRNTLLQAGMSGIGLALVFHEIERGIKTAHERLEKGGSTTLAIQQLVDIRAILADFSKLLRNENPSEHKLREVVKQSISINRIRFSKHNIILEGPFTRDDAPSVAAVFSRKLILGALTNLIDNAIHWTDVRWPDSGGRTSRKRKIWLGTSDDLGGPSIVIADTGTGFRDDPADLTGAFFSRRPDGMGLGLYYANMVMELVGGRLVFPEKGDIELPPEYADGAVIALVFGEQAKGR